MPMIALGEHVLMNDNSKFLSQMNFCNCNKFQSFGALRRRLVYFNKIYTSENLISFGKTEREEEEELRVV